MIDFEAKEDEAEERSRPEIERPAGLFTSEAVEEDFLNVRGQTGKIDQGERDVLRWICDLDWISGAHLETGAQGFVASHDLGYSSSEAERIERSTEADRGEQAEPGRARFELLQKPEALLREREGGGSGAGTGFDRFISEKLGLAVAELLEEELAGGRHSPRASPAASALPWLARSACSQRSIPKATHPEKAGWPSAARMRQRSPKKLRWKLNEAMASVPS